MSKKPAIFFLGVIAALIFMLPAASMAKDNPPPLADVWLITAKAGQGSELYEAIEKHMAFRAEHGDPRAWQVYSPMLGDELNRVAIRFCCFSWADQDAYSEWREAAENIGDHFGEHVTPHIENISHYFENLDWENSNWNEESGPYKLFAVTEFNLKPGKIGQYDAARNKMSQIALNQGWATSDHSWVWSSTIGGKSQGSIIIPHKSFADMDRDEEGFMEFLARHMGSGEAAAELMADFSESAWSSEFQIWEHDEDVSMSTGD